MSPVRPVVIGAGPAGLRAAQALVAAGLRPVLIDENPAPGGQIYRQMPAGFVRSPRALYGFEHKKAVAVHAVLAQLDGKIDYWPAALVWNAQRGAISVAVDGAIKAVTYTHLIVAAGATDRVLPFPGWLVPGVYTLGGSQVALKYQGCAIGRKVVFAGTGPLLYLVAYQYAKAGARVVAVLDTAAAAARRSALPGLLRAPALVGKGLYYMAWLRAHGVPLHSGVRLCRVKGDDRVAGIIWETQGAAGLRQHELACDAVACGYALRSETQIADLLGCGFQFSEQDRAWLPQRDAMGRTSVPGVYIAGDGAGISGADAAEMSGEQAAYALLQDLGLQTPSTRIARLAKALGKIAGIRRSLEKAFPFPAEWAADADDDLVVCRCEEVTVGQLRRAADSCGVSEMNRLKALSRVGMGRCQGRMCGPAAAEILARQLDVPVKDVGRLRSQAPVKPMPISTFETVAQDGGDKNSQPTRMEKPGIEHV